MAAYRRQHSHMKQNLPAFLSLPFRAEPSGEPLLDAISIAKLRDELESLGPDAPLRA